MPKRDGVVQLHFEFIKFPVHVVRASGVCFSVQLGFAENGLAHVCTISVLDELNFTLENRQPSLITVGSASVATG